MQIAQLSTALKAVEHFTLANSPAILTGLAVTGTATAAVFAGTASFKAARILDDHAEQIRVINDNAVTQDEIVHPLDTVDKIKLVWPLYVPAVGAAATAIVAAVAANQIGTRRTAAMAAAYSVTERAFDQYKDKVGEKFGEKKEQQVRDEIAQDVVADNPPSVQVINAIAGSDVLCFDQYTGRYFTSTMEGLRQAENAVNFMINNENYASLNDFYDALGIATIEMGDAFGWSINQQVRLQISTVIADDSRPCLSFGFETMPHSKYDKVINPDY